MKIRLSKPVSKLQADLVLPASKSISNRLLIINALSSASREPENLSDSDDTRVMLESLSSSGKIKNIGHAGTSMRFLTAYYSSREEELIMTGSARMKERPIAPLVDALRILGAHINYLEKEGFPPLEIRGGKLLGGEIEIDGSISSQFISALLLIAPSLEKGLKIRLLGKVVSSSYLKMTLELMKEHGAEYVWEGNEISIQAGNYIVDRAVVESDWSAASYWYAMAFLAENPSVSLSFLKNDSLQGDSALIGIFQQLGLKSEFEKDKINLLTIERKSQGSFEYDFTNCPDIVQSMAVCLCMANIPFHFTGTQTLRVKETDRIAALQNELKKLGYVLSSNVEGSILDWNGETCRPQENPLIETYHDHRMAMAFAPIALVRGAININDPDVVTKSYPKFWTDLNALGFGVEYY